MFVLSVDSCNARCSMPPREDVARACDQRLSLTRPDSVARRSSALKMRNREDKDADIKVKLNTWSTTGKCLR